MSQFKKWIGQKAEGSRVEQIAASAFRLRNPDKNVVGTRLRANEPYRYIVGIFYGVTKPSSYEFYTVFKPSLIVQPLEDDADYRYKMRR